MSLCKLGFLVYFYIVVVLFMVSCELCMCIFYSKISGCEFPPLFYKLFDVQGDSYNVDNGMINFLFRVKMNFGKLIKANFSLWH